MKTFRQFVSESPRIDPNLNPSQMENVLKHFNSIITNNHNNSNKIGDTTEGTLHHIDIYNNGKHHIYYHMVGNSPKERSVVSDNIHNYTSKYDGGNSKYIRQFMKYHAKNYGEIKSDKLQTKGSKKLWSDLVKENDPNFSVYHHDGINENKVDENYLKSNEKKIWGYDDKHENQQLLLKPNV